jgi:3-dehydroquinate dehydratase-1
MANKKIANNLPAKCSVVGVIHSESSLAAATRLAPEAIDYLEIRVDAFHGSEEKILSKIPKLKFPLIITVRHSGEGGLHRIPTAKRRALFEKFLPHAALVDIELRSARALADVTKAARKAGIGVILSHHNFRATPPASRLARLAREAKKAGADIFKIAALVSRPADVAGLLLFQDSQKPIPLSIMGMGRFGKVSRLLFAHGGSLLNYGFLDEANASGQWPAALLKKRIAELSV